MEISWIGCHSANYTAGRRGFHPEAIVVHTLPGDLAAAETAIFDASSQKSAHYAISLTGEVHQYVDESDTAFHAGIVVLPDWKLLKRNGVNPNFYTIGVAFENSPAAPWPGAQALAGNLLVLQIASRWGIPLDADHVIGHNRIRASQSCPSDSVDIARLLRKGPAANAAIPSSPIKLRTIRTANIRYQRPNTVTPIAEAFAANTEIEVIGFTLGERVHGNPYWYADASGNYIWAGATNRPDPAVAA
jgi:hypothetical protein